MKFLHEILTGEFGKRGIEAVNLPKSVSENLKFTIREYQKEAFKRFILLYENDFNGRPQLPLHTMFNMATGSGKTLVMAGLMLYLFEKGYKNFIFFVNSDNIIKKTKENFLNANSSKYLFTERIFINSNEIFIKECENFEGIQNENEINIKFCTIQKLHEDLIKSPKENAVTFEDLADRNIVLIADEAHHLSADTKNNAEILEEFQTPSWENTVAKILKLNSKNILLEFSATLDYESVEITEKYKDKVLFKYDLKAFREQGYSKEIELFKSDMSDKNKMMSAVIFNLYRSILAAVHGINLKPVILFKSKTINESTENEEKFRQLIDNLDENFIDNFREEIKDATITKAFKFFKTQDISCIEISKRIKQNFKQQNCINVNKEEEIKENQLIINSLEDDQNPIRAIFAVNKLNEGWDVLNLFDIVRLYKSRDGRNGKPGKTTISEAQLIGRGARYFPFKISSEDDKFKRKFDKDLDNELRILEEIYYHTSNDSRYISELKTALKDIGIYDENTVRKELKLKDSFKKTIFYKNAIVWHNDKILVGYDNACFEDIPSEIDFILGSILSSKEVVFNDEDFTPTSYSKSLKEKKIPKHILKAAMSTDEYFYFENLQENFVEIKSTSEFLKLLEDKFSINFKSDSDDRDISSDEYFAAAKKLLNHIKDNFEKISKYKSSEYKSTKFKEVFKDKSLNIAKDDERVNGQENIIGDKEWYIFNANYGTSEEKAFVEFFMSHFDEIKKKYNEIYLVRNEQELKIYNEDGQPFEPDFLLFCKDKSGDEINFQIFIEPKGDGYIANDKWKEEFLKKIFNDRITKNLSSESFLITAISKFYNKNSENEFKKEFEDLLLK